MYTIEAPGQQQQQQQQVSMMSILLNDTASKLPAAKVVDCAKECPCGVPAIPVPDQWLEVMVTGGFKVWHIIFIIIAFVVTLVVVYCCFHRCRIPRTKQEIEADLMRSTLANKFRDYLQELPNEPTTLVEALKKVQELEEKLEQEDAAAMTQRDLNKKRMGWLKLNKGANKGDPTGRQQQQQDNDATAPAANDKGEQSEGQQPAGQPSDSTVIQMAPLGAPAALAEPPKGVAGDQASKVAEDGPKKEAAKGRLLKLPAARDRRAPVESETQQQQQQGLTATTSTTTTGRRARRDKPKLSKTRGAHQLNSRSEHERTATVTVLAAAAAEQPVEPKTSTTPGDTVAHLNVSDATKAATLDAKPRVKTKPSAARRHRSAGRSKPAAEDTGEQQQQQKEELEGQRQQAHHRHHHKHRRHEEHS